MDSAWPVASTVLLVVGLWLVLSYNRFVSQRTLVQESWAQIDVELTRRHDLIPNLVATVQGYATHERNTLETVVRARADAVGLSGGTPAERQPAESALTAAVKSLLAVAESYPDLKASANFLHLQQELTNTEDRIAAGRRFYNANVRAYNTRIRSTPSNLVAGAFHFTGLDYFEADAAAREVPTVHLEP